LIFIIFFQDEKDNTPFVLLNDAFIGFVVGIDTNKRFASVILIEKYAAWISTNAQE
jgi:hypothetical protein